MSNSVQPHIRQSTRLRRPWDSSSKNTGVGCHCLFQCMKVKSESEVAQSCPTLDDPMDCSPPGSSTMGFSRQEYWSGVPGGRKKTHDFSRYPKFHDLVFLSSKYKTCRDYFLKKFFYSVPNGLEIVIVSL